MVVGETEILVAIDLMEDLGRYVVRAEIGKPAPETELLVYRHMLTLGSLWTRTGGLSVALLGLDGPLCLVYAGDVSQLTARTLATLVVNMAARAGMLSVAIAAESFAEVEAVKLEDDLSSTVFFRA